MNRDELPPNANDTYVVPDLRIVYVSVPKAACTSLKWLVAGLSGEDPHAFGPALRPEVTRATTIHRRSSWLHTPRLHDLSDAELAPIGAENGWFVFAVVRHPTVRLWSAWQSKFLLAEPHFVRRFANEPWLPAVPHDTEDVATAFRAFAVARAGEGGRRVGRDPHFRPQRRLLTPDRTPYGHIYHTSAIDQLLEDLTSHLTSQGWQGTLSLPNNNETPLPLLASMLTDDVTRAVDDVYRADLRRFDFGDVVPPGLSTASEYPSSMLDEVRRLVERAQRIGDLAAIARGLHERNEALQEELDSLRCDSPSTTSPR
jgi:hypothetical protein